MRKLTFIMIAIVLTASTTVFAQRGRQAAGQGLRQNVRQRAELTEEQKAILEKADIIITPGSGFGKSGEGYVRMALTVSSDQLTEAVKRIKKAFFLY